MIPSLYVHIPVCLKKCDYCDFFSLPIGSFPGCTDGIPRFAPLIKAITKEIAYRKQEFQIDRWKTVYIGGGTPSLLSAVDIHELAAPIASLLFEDGEFTIEANPEDLNPEWLSACKDAGINRLSLGIQSMHDESLEAVHRRGTARSNRKALDLVKKHWNGTLSLDLISGLPGQTQAILGNDITELLSYDPDHVSLYDLTIEEGTPLEKRIRLDSGRSMHQDRSNFPRMPDSDESADLWIRGRDLLENRGYRQYEVSNFAKPGSESKHNMTYWNLATYIGVGAGATGTFITDDTAYRRINTTDLTQWLMNPELSFSVEHISRQNCIKEVLLMGMRTLSGITRKHFLARFGTDVCTLIPQTIIVWQKKDFLEVTDSSVALNRDGLLFLNQFLSSCIDELDTVSASPAH